jgi:hypothetical protein
MVKIFIIKLIPSSYTLLQTLGVIVRIEGIWGFFTCGKRQETRETSLSMDLLLQQSLKTYLVFKLVMGVLVLVLMVILCSMH